MKDDCVGITVWSHKITHGVRGGRVHQRPVVSLQRHRGRGVGEVAAVVRRVVIIMIIVIIVIFIAIFIVIIMIKVIIAGHGVAEVQKEESRSGASGHGDMFPLVTRQH